MLDPAGQSGAVHVDDQAGPLVHGHGQRLGAAHAAASGGQGQGAGEGPSEALGGHGGERLVGALDDALRADVDPGPGGHLPVHGQAEGLEPAELRPGGPVPDEVRVGDQDSRGPLVGAHHTDRPSGLDQHGLVVAQRRQRPDQGMEAGPVAGRPARPAVDHERVRVLGDLWVEVVLQHPQRSLLRPAQRCAGRSPGRANPDRGAELVGHGRLLSFRLSPAGRRRPRPRRAARRRRSLCRRRGSPRRRSGPGPDRRRRCARAARAAPVPAAGEAGARRSRARAAVISSIASTWRSPVHSRDAASVRWPSPSTRGPPASPSWGSSRRWPGQPAA